MKQFLIALIATVTVVLGAALISESIEPDVPPHSARPIAATPTEGLQEGPPQRPGSSLEGLTLVSARISHYVAAEQQRAAEALAAEQALAAAQIPESSEVPPQVNPPSDGSGSSANWDAVAQCETGGNWQMTGSSYSGGLGFANGSWNAYGGQEFADLAGHATREQQIQIAERIYADNGYKLSGAWGCSEDVIG